MSASTEHAGTVSFAEGAESILKRQTQRFERELRSLSVSEAVKRRGLPAEVTSSDVVRAAGRLSVARRYRDVLPADRTLLDIEQMREERFAELEDDAERPLPRRDFRYLVGTVYLWGGILVTVGGLLYPWVVPLLEDPLYRIGFSAAAGGILMGVLGGLFRKRASFKSRL